MLQTVLFLTDSVFRVLFAYFDASMASIGGYEPWESWNTVDITPIQIKNDFTTIPKVVIYFLILTELTRFLLKFTTVKDLMDYGIRSGKSLSLGMPKAPQGNIQGKPRA